MALTPNSLTGGSQGFKSPHLHSTLMTSGNVGRTGRELSRVFLRQRSESTSLPAVRAIGILLLQTVGWTVRANGESFIRYGGTYYEAIRALVRMVAVLRIVVPGVR